MMPKLFGHSKSKQPASQPTTTTTVATATSTKTTIASFQRGLHIGWAIISFCYAHFITGHVDMHQSGPPSESALPSAPSEPLLYMGRVIGGHVNQHWRL